MGADRRRMRIGVDTTHPGGHGQTDRIEHGIGAHSTRATVRPFGPHVAP